ASRPDDEASRSHLGRQRIDEDRQAFNRIIVVVIIVIIFFFFRFHIGIRIGIGDRPGARLRRTGLRWFLRLHSLHEQELETTPRVEHLLYSFADLRWVLND